MASLLSFDEINKIVGYKKSISVDDYFKPMVLSVEQKAERKKLAIRFDEVFIECMIMLFTMYQYKKYNWEMFRKSFRDSYLDALGDFFIIDSVIRLRAEKLADDVTDASKRHLTNPNESDKSKYYYFSADRSRVISNNEANVVYDYKDFMDSVDKGMKEKTWRTMKDEFVRDSHKDLEGMTIPINEYFQNGLLYPHDINGDESEVLGCRCSLTYSQ